MTTRREALAATAAAFTSRGLPQARQEAEWLCASLFSIDRLQLFLDGDARLSPEEDGRLRELTARRLAGEPLQYLLGTAEFYGLTLEVGPGVLIPRPETEELVRLALARYPGCGAVCDLCTGSGAVALALATNLPTTVAISAVDLSPHALAFARRNAARLNLNRIQFLEGDLFAPLPATLRFTLITANPPYIGPEPYDLLPDEVRRHEPVMALRAAENGLAVIRRIAAAAPARLTPGGWLLCEIGSDQADAVAALFTLAGLSEVAILPDPFGKPRFVSGKMRN